VESACAIGFFLYYADDHHAYRHHILGPRGLGFLVSRLAAVETPLQSSEWVARMFWLCLTLEYASARTWAIPVLLDLDICHVMAKSLMSVIALVISASFFSCLYSLVHMYMQVLHTQRLTTGLSGHSTTLLHLRMNLNLYSMPFIMQYLIMFDLSYKV
jgi:hypothetical protein